MLIYTIITLAISIPFIWLGIRINRGDLNLIHDYHQKKVKEEEKAAYGKAFSKGMFGMAASMIVSGLVALFGESAMWGAVAVLLGGLAIGIVSIVRIQKKYNGGVF